MFFSIRQDDISPRLSQIAARARNKVPVLRAMGTTFKSITEGTFNSVGASFRPVPWPAKKDGSPSILQKSTTLAKSFHLSVSNDGATLSNPMPYAAIHQFGGRTAPHRIVPRKGKALKFGGKFFAAVNHPGSNIPARPFFPVDAGGQLIPKAENLIARAGERELAKQIGV